MSGMQMKREGLEMAMVRGAIPAEDQSMGPIHVVETIGDHRGADDFRDSQLTTIDEGDLAFEVGQRNALGSFNGDRLVGDQRSERFEVCFDLRKIAVDHHLIPWRIARRLESSVNAWWAKSQSNHAGLSLSVPALNRWRNRLVVMRYRCSNAASRRRYSWRLVSRRRRCSPTPALTKSVAWSDKVSVVIRACHRWRRQDSPRRERRAVPLSAKRGRMPGAAAGGAVRPTAAAVAPAGTVRSPVQHLATSIASLCTVKKCKIGRA